MVIVMFPLRWQFKEGGKYRKPHKLMKAYCNSRGIVFVDLWSPYEKEGADEMYIYMGDSTHPSEMGHLIAAEEIFKQIGTPDLPLRRRILYNKGDM